MTNLSVERRRTGIVGCGKVAATHAAAWRRLPASQLVGVCDRNLDRAKALAAQFAVRAYGDLAEMIEAERLEVLSVCTQHTQRAGLIETAARHGVHVIAEKPLAVDLASCDRAIAACGAAGVKLGVISQRRYYEPVQRMKAALESGRLGKPVLAEAVMLGWRDPSYYTLGPWRGTWQGEGGGVAVSQAPHYLDLLSWFMGPVRELYAYWDNYNHSNIEVDDTVVASVRFESGAMGSIILSNSQRPGLYGKIHIHSSSGASVGAETDSGSPFISGVTEKMDPPFNDIWTVPGEEGLLAGWIEEDRSRPWNVMTHYHEVQLEEFLNAVIENHEPAIDGAAGRRVVELFTAIYQSQREGKPARFPL